MGEKLHITFFGRFTMRYPAYDGPGIITNQDSTSWRIWAFLQYLCAFHDRAVTQEEIIDMLWTDVDLANPVNSVKTLLHRSRLMLEKLGIPNGKTALAYRRGIYSWDQDLTIWTDISEFDQLCTNFYALETGEEKAETVRRALALYQGDFLPGAAGSPWALSPRTYYHNKFLRLSVDAASMLWEMKRMDEAIDVCRSAAALDPYDETCQLMMMRLLHASGARQMAAQYYSEVSNLLMAQLGITPSEEITALYHELARANEAPELDLRTIRAGLVDREQETGAFFCEYNVFRDIYNLIVRAAPRSGQVVQLSVITILDWDGSALSGAQRTAAMEELRKAIERNLRSGDVVTQLSAMQYLLMLPTASFENGGMAIERVLSEYRSTAVGMTTTAQCSVLSALSSEQQKLPEIKTGFAADVQGQQPKETNEKKKATIVS